MKQCTKCKEFKPLTEFSKDSQKKSGLRPYCKKCAVVYMTKYQQKDTSKEQHYEAVKKYRSKGKGKAIYCEAAKKYRINNPEKKKAHNLFNSEVRFGRIFPPRKCEKCYAVLPLKAHHFDYKKPLIVTWVCQKCHTEIHRKIESMELINCHCPKPDPEWRKNEKE